MIDRPRTVHMRVSRLRLVRNGWTSRLRKSRYSDPQLLGIEGRLHAASPLHLSDMEEFEGQPVTLGASLLMKHAGAVGRDDIFGSGAHMIMHLVMSHLC